MAFIKCKECGKKISDMASACIYCGCPIEKTIICEECGKEITDDDRICKNCGYKATYNINTSKAQEKYKKEMETSSKYIKDVGLMILYFLIMMSISSIFKMNIVIFLIINVLAVIIIIMLRKKK